MSSSTTCVTKFLFHVSPELFSSCVRMDFFFVLAFYNLFFHSIYLWIAFISNWIFIKVSIDFFFQYWNYVSESKRMRERKENTHSRELSVRRDICRLIVWQTRCMQSSNIWNRFWFESTLLPIFFFLQWGEYWLVYYYRMSAYRPSDFNWYSNRMTSNRWNVQILRHLYTYIYVRRMQIPNGNNETNSNVYFFIVK